MTIRGLPVVLPYSDAVGASFMISMASMSSARRVLMIELVTERPSMTINVSDDGARPGSLAGASNLSEAHPHSNAKTITAARRIPE